MDPMSSKQSLQLLSETAFCLTPTQNTLQINEHPLTPAEKHKVHPESPIGSGTHKHHPHIHFHIQYKARGSDRLMTRTELQELQVRSLESWASVERREEWQRLNDVTTCMSTHIHPRTTNTYETRHANTCWHMCSSYTHTPPLIIKK